MEKDKHAEEDSLLLDMGMEFAMQLDNMPVGQCRVHKAE